MVKVHHGNDAALETTTTKKNTIMNASSSSSSSSQNRPGRPTGFRLKYALTAAQITDGISQRILPGSARMTIVNERQRTPEEIMEIIKSNPQRLTDAAFMASLTVERLEGGMSLRDVAGEMGGDAKIDIARVDISNFYDLAKERALKYLADLSRESEE